MNNQKAAGGILFTQKRPSGPKRDESVDAGRYESKLWHNKDYRKIQLLTIEGLLSGTERVDAPPQVNPCQRPARTQAGEAGGFDLVSAQHRRCSQRCFR